ncbi:MAG TPA: SAM-dependent methyltransferase [Actinobacteria bacterium]|nr:SAM-dependent methyltransferase [Actinomycetota bacterium]
MRIYDAIAFVGHQVHFCRYREAGTLLRWLGNDLRGQRVLDVAGGDGYWAAQARKRGAHAISIDLARTKMNRGGQLRFAPALLEADALRLPFRDASFDRVMSICAIEHFDDGPRSLAEMARVLAPGGELVMSADAITRADEWPRLFDVHCTRYAVKHTYTHERLAGLLAERGLDLMEHTYQFRTRRAEHFYLAMAAVKGKAAPNAAALAVPLVAVSDRRAPNDHGSVVLIRARKRGG